MAEIVKTLPVVKLQSPYFAGKAINLAHLEHSGEKFGNYPSGAVVYFDADGFALVNPDQADEITDSPSYRNLVFELDRFEADFVLELDDEDFDGLELDEEDEPTADEDAADDDE